MNGFEGSYPGGPRRRKEGEEPVERPHLEGVDDIEDRRARTAGYQSWRERRRRVRIGFVVAVLVSGGIGLALGYMGHKTPADLARDSQRAGEEQFEASEEVNRVLLELWKMEDLERSPR